MSLRLQAKSILIISAFYLLSACADDFTDTRIDHGLDHKPLSQLKAQVWTDPEGCDHWIIDDGLEGYMSPRLTPDGIPVCRADALPERIYNMVNE